MRLLTAAADHVVAMLNAARDYRARHVELMDQCDATFEMLPWIAVRWPQTLQPPIPIPGSRSRHFGFRSSQAT